MRFLRVLARLLLAVWLCLGLFTFVRAQLVQEGGVWQGTQPNKGRVAIILIHGIQPGVTGIKDSSNAGRATWDQLVNDPQIGADFAHDSVLTRQAVVYRYGYDYRSSNVVNASYLKVFIDAIVLASDPDARIVFVCHSNGGLVARYYIEHRGGDKHLARLITLGTPHDGTPVADLGWKAPGTSIAFWQMLAGAGIVSTSFDFRGISDLQWDDLPLSFNTVVNRDLQNDNLSLSSRPSDFLNRYYVIGGDVSAGQPTALGFAADVLRPAFRSDGVVPLISARLEGVRRSDLVRITAPDITHTSFVTNDYTRLLTVGLARQAVVQELSRRSPPGGDGTNSGAPSSGSGPGSLQSGPPGSSVGTVVSESNKASSQGAPGCWLGGTPNYFWATFGVGDGDHMIYTFTHGRASDNRAVYTPVLPSAGYYDVKAYVPRLHGTSTDVRYTVTHADGIAVVKLNQLAISDAFVSLGTYRFDAGSVAHVTVDDYSEAHGDGAKQIAIDTIKFEATSTPADLQPGDSLPATELGSFFHTPGGLLRTFIWKDGGTTKGRPNYYHDVMVISNETGETLAESGWIQDTQWNWTFSQPTSFRWLVFSNNGVDARNAVSDWSYGYAGTMPFPTLAGLGATGTSSNAVQLGFYTDAKGFDEYVVARSTNDGPFVTVAYVGQDKESYFDSGLLPQTRYRYQIRLYRDDGTTSRPYETQEILTDPPPPSAPQGLTAVFVGATASDSAHIHLKWNPVMDARSYMVWRSEGDVILPYFYSEGAEYNDYSLTSRRDYVYWVSCEAGGPSSELSTPVTVSSQQILGPPNDDISAALNIEGDAAKVQVNTRFATLGPNEPHLSETGGGAAVWYRWTATSNWAVTLSVLGNHPLVGIFEVDSQGKLVGVQDALRFIEDQRATLRASIAKGHTYYIELDDAVGAGISAQLYVTQSPDPPANDNRDQAQALEAPTGSWVGDVRSASAEPYELPHAGVLPSHSVWFRYRSTTSQSLTLDTFGSDGDTTLEVYSNSSDGSLHSVVSNRQSGDGLTTTSRLRFVAAAATDYLISADYLGSVDPGQGHLRLNWTPTPTNDSQASAAALTGERGTRVDSSLGATSEYTTGAESRILGLGGGATIWYKFVAPATGNFGFSTYGTGFDTLMQLFQASGSGGITSIGANDDRDAVSTSSRINASLKGGQTYYLVVDGKAVDASSSQTQPAMGAIKLSWARADAGPNTFKASGADRIVTLEWSDELADDYTLTRDGQALTTTTATRYSDTGLQNGTTYHYDLSMRFGDLRTLTAVPAVGVPGPVPAPPSSADLSLISSTSIQVRWAILPAGVSAKVSRSINGSPFTTIGQINGSLRVLNDTKVAPGNRYTYRVAASNSTGESTPKDAGSVVVPPRAYLDNIALPTQIKQSATLTGSISVRGHNVNEIVTVKVGPSSNAISCSPATTAYRDTSTNESPRMITFTLKARSNAKVGTVVTVTATLGSSTVRANVKVIKK